jgi:signal transduction protein with GAF and PtsI domain
VGEVPVSPAAHSIDSPSFFGPLCEEMDAAPASAVSAIGSGWTWAAMRETAAGSVRWLVPRRQDQGAPASFLGSS